MKAIKESLIKNIEHFLEYDKKNAIEEIVKSVFESILKLERSEFLNISNDPENKANGYYQRLARSINQYIKINVPRDRLSEFKPVFLDAINRYDSQLLDLSFKLYTHGLTTENIKKIMDEIFGKKISTSSISNITKEFQKTREAWVARPIEEEYYFIYIDALWIPVRRDTVTKEAFYIVLGLRKDLKRDVLGVYNIPVESAEGWKIVLQDLKNRGLKKVLMIIADGLAGLENIIKVELPETHFQKCLVHKIRNINLRARTKDKAQLKEDFHEVFCLEDQNFTIEEGKKKLEKFILKWKKVYPHFQRFFQESQVEYYFSYLKFPHQIHRMIYTTNWIERLNKSIRKTEKVRNSFPNPDSALNLICAFLMDYEKDVYRHKISSFLPVQDKLDHLLGCL